MKKDSACHIGGRGDGRIVWKLMDGRGEGEYHHIEGEHKGPSQRHNTARSTCHSSFHHKHPSSESWVMEKLGLCGLSEAGSEEMTERGIFLPSRLIELHKANVPSLILNLLPSPDNTSLSEAKTHKN